MYTEYTTPTGIDKFLADLTRQQETAKHKIEVAQEKIDSIGLYRRALETYVAAHPDSPPIHLRAWEIRNELLVSFEVRDYSLATAVKIALAPTPDYPDQTGRGLVWQIIFSCGEITHENGFSQAIVCRDENSFDDKYHTVREIGVMKTYCDCSHVRSSFSCPHTFYTNILQHKDPEETCKYYQKKGVIDPVIAQLRTALDDLFKETDQEVFDKMQAKWREEEKRIFAEMDALPEPLGLGKNEGTATG